MQTFQIGAAPCILRRAHRTAVEVDDPDALGRDQNVVCIQIGVISAGGMECGDLLTDAACDVAVETPGR